MIRVLICEDQRLVREGLATILSLEDGISVAGEAASGEEAIEKVRDLSPDIVLMDVQMRGMDGVQATRIIAGQYPDTKVIILTTYDSEEYVFEGVKAGAMGYVLKDTPAPELVMTIERVHAGEQLIQPAVASKILFEFAKSASKSQSETREEPISTQEPLNEREIAIISRLAQGMSNREIAEDMALAEGTVRNYASNILSKLHAVNRVQAINLARERRII